MDVQGCAVPGLCNLSGHNPGDGFVALREQNVVPSLYLFYQIGKVCGSNFFDHCHGLILQVFLPFIECRLASDQGHWQWTVNVTHGWNTQTAPLPSH
jgi:hypothetical protein